MAATGAPQGLARRKAYTSSSVADTTSWASPQYMADWVLIEGAGTTVLVAEDGGTFTDVRTTQNPDVILPGPWSQFTSTTCTRVTMGNGPVPPAQSPPATAVAALSGSLGAIALTGGLGGGGTAGSPVLNVSAPNVTGTLPSANMSTAAAGIIGGVALTGGLTGTAGSPVLNVSSGNVTGIMPAGISQTFVDVSTIYNASFAAATAALNAYMFTSASQTATLPAITSALAGIPCAFVNLGTGATAANIAASGTAYFVGAGGATSATVAPKSGAAVRFIPSNFLNAWIQGV